MRFIKGTDGAIKLVYIDSASGQICGDRVVYSDDQVVLNSFVERDLKTLSDHGFRPALSEELEKVAQKAA